MRLYACAECLVAPMSLSPLFLLSSHCHDQDCHIVLPIRLPTRNRRDNVEPQLDSPLMYSLLFLCTISIHHLVSLLAASYPSTSHFLSLPLIRIFTFFTQVPLTHNDTPLWFMHTSPFLPNLIHLSASYNQCTYWPYHVPYPFQRNNTTKRILPPSYSESRRTLQDN